MRIYTTTIRLSAIDKRNAKAIIQSGAAHNVSEAIRVALYEAAERRRVSAQGQERTA